MALFGGTRMRTSAMAVVALLAMVSLSFAADSPVQLTELTVEHMTNPVGIGIAHPRFSWKLQSDRPGEVQTAYEIRAASTSAALANQPDLWDSGKVASDQSVLVRWGGKPLDSRAIVYLAGAQSGTRTAMPPIGAPPVTSNSASFTPTRRMEGPVDHRRSPSL
jgi:hypothetical protein